jgi:phosphate transport system permease protein
MTDFDQTLTIETLPEHFGEDVPTRPSTTPTAPDRVFRGTALAAASVSFVIVAMTFVFLVLESRRALKTSGTWSFFTGSLWNQSTGKFGILGLLVGTIMIAVIALIVAVPLSLAMALFINEYAPPKIQAVLTSAIDLLAALPSLLFGMWGFFAFQHKLVFIAKFFADHLGAIPIFRVKPDETTLAASAFTAGVVVALMIMPIITSVSRDVMAQCPRDQCEGALALGGSKWGMIRDVLLPYGRSGIIGATILGFGRAMGETIAVAFLIVIIYPVKFRVLTKGTGSIAAQIATHFGDAGDLERSALVGAGLALFTVTFVVNLLARTIVARAGKQ